MICPLHLVAYRGTRGEWVETLEFDTAESRQAARVGAALRLRRQIRSATRIQWYTCPPPDGCQVRRKGVGRWPERLGFVVGEDGRARRR